MNDTEGLKRKSGPALMAWKSSPSSVNVTSSTSPEGVPSIGVMLVTRESPPKTDT